ncbi:MAG TPA: T9SS type A sorting domain-containing protein [Bacteroidales bacterium]|nr:T9SS type A sorting domain-containing protein [Bacteroidales bacterium]HOK99567.1 T9SS type A sorting domain-containing protein [Bacteroidales bacterium]HPO66294.1 T9SS type A sorting domain-containing protein [Bacteroidales bacterium]
MKRSFCTLFMIGTMTLLSLAQSLRYFEFSTQCGHGNWQDSSFIAATSVQEVIDSVIADLQRPYEQRKFITGPIAPGHGGHNHNANHWFKWHYIPNEWVLTEMAIEICDGCPYSDLDADTSYWIRTIGRFCPWSGKPVREVMPPDNHVNTLPKVQIFLFPNPAQKTVRVAYPGTLPAVLAIYSMTGHTLIFKAKLKNNETIDLSNLEMGLYLIHIYNNAFSTTERLWVNK